jgi:hypothetical protein
MYWGAHFVVWSKQTSVRTALLRSMRVKRAPRRSADVKSARVMLVSRRFARRRFGRRQINEASGSILRSRSCRVQLAMSFLIARNTLSMRRPSATAFSPVEEVSRFHHAM